MPSNDLNNSKATKVISIALRIKQIVLTKVRTVADPWGRWAWTNPLTPPIIFPQELIRIKC